MSLDSTDSYKFEVYCTYTYCVLLIDSLVQLDLTAGSWGQVTLLKGTSLYSFTATQQFKGLKFTSQDTSIQWAADTSIGLCLMWIFVLEFCCDVFVLCVLLWWLTRLAVFWFEVTTTMSSLRGSRWCLGKPYSVVWEKRSIIWALTEYCHCHSIHLYHLIATAWSNEDVMWRFI